MDVVKAMQFYVNKMVNEVPGMKVLLLDNETTSMISLIYTQSELLGQQVFLVDKLAYYERREVMKHLNCVVFARPVSESLEAIEVELKKPHFGSYHLYFTNILKKSQIERLAEVDDNEVVKDVQEFFGDFYAVHSTLFSLNIPRCMSFNGDGWDMDRFQRTLDGLVSVTLSLKKRPAIRYEKSSHMAEKLALEFQSVIDKESQLFDFRKPDTPPVVLILDRKSDPITPLLTQWTYQAMIHGLLGISNGRVDMSKTPEIKPDLKEIVLNPLQDAFYSKNMFLNLGDLGANIKDYVAEYQVKTKSTRAIESLSDMKKFVEEYPEFKKMSGHVSKHVALVGELCRLVEVKKLLRISELEQSIACTDNHVNDLKDLTSLIEDPAIDEDDKIRCALIYALRYEKMGQLSSVIDALTKQMINVNKIKVKNIQLIHPKWIDALLASAQVRQTDLFSLENIISKGKSAFRGLKGVENIYTQHNPRLSQTLEFLIKGKQKELNTLFPFVQGSLTPRDKPQDIIVFFVNGTTYEEDRCVYQLNQMFPQTRIVLGGTFIHNTESFVQDAVQSFK